MARPAPTLDDLRRFAVARSLFTPTTLARAIDRLGFVQADPIRAPARAQDLVLRHRVRGYRAGDLERKYHALPIAEDYFINYGFLAQRHVGRMHPRVPTRAWTKTARERAAAILEFVRERGEAHPREVDEHFAHGRVKNYWGGSSNATTHLLDAMHYRGLLRVARRDAGVRIYAPVPAWPVDHDPASAARNADALVELVVEKYAPLPGLSLAQTASRVRLGAPQLRAELKGALGRARANSARAEVDGIAWYWPADEDPRRAELPAVARFLAPFDPVVWDRRRFELLWGWAYRFEAYTPAPKRKLGYYALPLLWRDQVVGWGNLAVREGELSAELGFVSGRAPAERAFARELEAEIERMRAFLRG